MSFTSHDLDLLAAIERYSLTSGSNRMGRRQREDEVGHLFALATARLEDAHSIAIAGQNPRLTPVKRRDLKHRLLRAIERCRLAAERIGTSLD